MANFDGGNEKVFKIYPKEVDIDDYLWRESDPDCDFSQQRAYDPSGYNGQGDEQFNDHLTVSDNNQK